MSQIIADGYYSTFIIDISERYSQGYLFEHTIENLTTGEIGTGVGYLDPETTDLHVYNYSGPAYMESWYYTYSYRMIKHALSNADYNLSVLCSSGIEKFGFQSIYDIFYG